MKKTICLLMAMCLLSVFIVEYIQAQTKPLHELSEVQTNFDPSEGGGASGNTATSYSTYDSPIFGLGGTNIFRCGVCKTVKSKMHSDPGRCRF